MDLGSVVVDLGKKNKKRNGDFGCGHGSSPWGSAMGFDYEIERVDNAQAEEDQ